ncbi:MAG: hypothetical protein AB1705_10625 [Verrucomicrobiota bacterium]
MKISARTQSIGVALYSLPFLAVIALSLFFVWAGDHEMVVAGAALLPAVLYFLGVRWCHYVVGVFAAIGFLAATMIPLTSPVMNRGRYFWVIWTPIWLLFAFSALVSFVPVRQKNQIGDGPG